MLKFKFNFFGGGSADDYWFGISPEGFGSLAMVVNFVVSYIVMKFTSPTPEEIKKIVDNIRIPENVSKSSKKIKSKLSTGIKPAS